MKNDIERIFECWNCKYLEKCEQTVVFPEDYPDGSCKTKDNFRDKSDEAGCS